jgi:hypothetical protein
VGVAGEERGPGSAEQQGARRAHRTSTATWRSTTVGRNRSRGRYGGGGDGGLWASCRGQGRGVAREGGSQTGGGLGAPLTRRVADAGFFYRWLPRGIPR